MPSKIWRTSVTFVMDLIQSNWSKSLAPVPTFIRCCASSKITARTPYRRKASSRACRSSGTSWKRAGLRPRFSQVASASISTKHPPLEKRFA